MNINEFSQKMIELSPKIVRGLACYEHNSLTRGEITLPQFWVLDYLYRNGTVKMNILATYLKVSQPSTTGLIDRLIVHGLVNRKADSKDRRIVLVELSSKGHKVINEIRKQKVKTLIKVFSKISMQDRMHYLDILGKIVKIINVLPSQKT